MSIRGVLLALAVGAAVVGFLVLDHRATQVLGVPELPIAHAPDQAATSTDCQVEAPTRLNGDTWSEKTELLLASNDVVRLRTCSPGQLSLTARGTAVDGYGPYMVISQAGSVLWEGEVAQRSEVAVNVPGTGWLAIAFMNDRNDPPQDRNLWLEQLEFSTQPAEATGG